MQRQQAHSAVAAAVAAVVVAAVAAAVAAVAAAAVVAAVEEHTAAAGYAAVEASKLQRAESGAVEATMMSLTDFAAEKPPKLPLHDCAAVKASKLSQGCLLCSGDHKPRTYQAGRSRVPVDALEASYMLADSPAWDLPSRHHSCLAYAHYGKAGAACMQAACPARIHDHRLVVDQDCRVAAC